MLKQDKNELSSISNEYNININVNGTVNGNVAGINNGIIANTTSDCTKENTTYTIRPRIKDSNRESHKLINKALEAQRDGNINVIISILRQAIDSELSESVPDLNTVAFSKYLLVHYLLADSHNDENILLIIDDILQTKDIEKDVPFYCDVLLKKAHTLFLNGQVKKARAVINIVDKLSGNEYKEESTYLQIVGQLTLLEGNTDDAVYLLSKGRDNALSKYVIAISEEDKFSNYQHYFAFLTCLGEAYRLLHRPDLSFGLWKNAVEIADEIGWVQEKVRPLLGLIECFIQYEDFNNADIKLDDLYSIIVDNDNPALLKQYYHYKATIQLQKGGSWREAINCFRSIFKISLNPDERVGILRTIADIQANHGDTKAALQNLEEAKKINLENGCQENNDVIDVQCNDIKQGVLFVDGQVRHTFDVPNLNDLYLLERKYNKCENAVNRLSMSLEIGKGYIDIDPDCAFGWLSKTFENASKMKDNLIAAEALIGQACILFGKQSQENERIAEKYIDTIIDMLNDIPQWEIRARAKMFKGMAEAHKENFKDAYQQFCEAKKILELHRVRDQFLFDCISDCVDECKYILSKSKFTDIDFDTIIEETNFFKSWYPKYKKDLIHFLWYNRHEDIERLLVASPKSKAFLVSDSSSEILQWCDKLNSIFDIFSFSSETDYHTNENWNFSTFIPIPKNMKSDFFNVFLVLNPT